MTYNSINQYIDVRERKVILITSLGEISNVNTNSNSIVLLGNKDDFG